MYSLRADASAKIVIPQKSSCTHLNCNAATFAIGRNPDLTSRTLLVQTHALANILVPEEVRLTVLGHAFAFAGIKAPEKAVVTILKVANAFTFVGAPEEAWCAILIEAFAFAGVRIPVLVSLA